MKNRRGLLLACILAGLIAAAAAAGFLVRTAPPAGSRAARAEGAVYSSMTDTAYLLHRLRLQDSVWTKTRFFDAPLLEEVLDKSKTAGFPKGIFTAAGRMGHHLLLQDSAAYALGYFLEALPYAGYPAHRAKGAGLYWMIGQCYANCGQYNTAVSYYNKSLQAIRYSEPSRMASDSFDVYNHLGTTWGELREKSLAISAFRVAQDIGLRLHDTEMVLMTLGNIGAVYSGYQEADTAEPYYRQMLTLAHTAHDFKGEAEALGALAQIAGHRQQYDRGLAYIERALRDSVFRQLRPALAIHLRSIQGTLYQQVHRQDEAERILEQAATGAAGLRNPHLVQALERKLARAYATGGKYHQAYRHMYRYSELGDSLVNQEKARTLEVSNSILLAEKDKAMLKQQLFIAQQQARLQRHNLLSGGLAAGALILIGIGFLLLRGYRHRQAAQQSRIAHLEQQQEIAMLKAKVQGEEEERTRIGRELHDNIASQLWAIKLNVDSLQQAADPVPLRQEKLSAVYQQLSDAGRDIRRTAHNLMPDLLLEDGLAAALASLCERTKGQAGIEVDFLEYGNVPALDREIGLSIYRMVQELLQNALKHAVNATQLLVQLGCAEMLLNITVEDNGSGGTSLREGIGLQQIRRRTATLRGHFDIQSVPGRGTTAYLEFDLRHFL